MQHRRPTETTAIFVFLFCLLVGLAKGALARERAGPVLVIEVEGAIGVAAVEQLEKALAEARARDAAALVLRLDTPGGLVVSTRAMIKAILGAPVPVILWVAPSGARAASAGTYLAYAAHLAAMAPGTHIGAATPIALGAPPTAPREPGGEKDRPAPTDAAERKALNDAIAYLRSLARLRGRNAEWAEAAVREAATLTAEEAVEKGVVELLAGSLPELLEKAHGRPVRLAEGERTLLLRDRPVETLDPGLRLKVLQAIADPNIAFVLLLVGIYGILFEFWNPGTFLPGIVGGIALFLALAALSVLPVQMAGVALLLLGIALMVAEAFTPGIGILGLGGLAAFIAGAFFLFDPGAADFDLRVALPVLIAAAGVSALLLMGVLGAAMGARRRRVAAGAEALLGAEGRVVAWDGREGRVRVQGELWDARADRSLAPGQLVRVKQRRGLVLDVEPIEEKPS
ncbi:MAG: nodulation protein NfeD [Geminicoccaceae bacterium]|nr:nodulation protein NfeD [Geminicoccaceae bacterium]MDW8342423.1 nodulation protein NfeD [Geminicoccaceae bacterium]